MAPYGINTSLLCLAVAHFSFGEKVFDSNDAVLHSSGFVYSISNSCLFGALPSEVSLPTGFIHEIGYLTTVFIASSACRFSCIEIHPGLTRRCKKDTGAARRINTVRAIGIMVVDDLEQWRTTLKSIVESMPGYQVVAEAPDALEAIAQAGQLRPDIVLLDIGLPLLNGIEAAPRIRRVSPDSTIIFLTQEHDLDIRIAALATGAEGYLLKSRVAADLRHTLDAARRISRRQPVSSHLETPDPNPSTTNPELRS